MRKNHAIRIIGFSLLILGSFLIPTLAAKNQIAPFVVPEVVLVPAGKFITGSDPAERELGYKLDERAYGHSITRKNRWYDFEAKRQEIELPVFSITKNLITNALYTRFITETGYRAPDVDKKTWASYGLNPTYKQTRRYAWKDAKPPKGRLQHPVVLVSLKDAQTFALWLSRKTRMKWQLPTEKQWEKAARGPKGLIFPWGNTFDPAKLNSNDNGLFDTQNVGNFPQGASPYGMLDAAGQVFEWTATATTPQRHLVKGGSWDDKGCGVCRSAARHARPVQLKHILIGFRLITTSNR
jgi:toxoflavin biosynthesis protein ToxD